MAATLPIVGGTGSPLTPAYDDIARFHYHGARWHLRSIMEGGSAGREFTSKPLSKKVFREILDGIMNSVG